jgi:glycine betaine/proline transport system ATP-binding protein
LAADPELLLMDEPFSALDPLIRRQLQEEFINLSKKMKKTTIFITHDLDEAVRVGHRIAIMRDGQVIQVGTPEEIILNPVDEYVKEFVKGISRLKVVKAHSIMMPIENYKNLNQSIPKNSYKILEDDNLNKIIEAAINQDEDITVYDESNNLVGIIDKKNLLKNVVEK